MFSPKWKKEAKQLDKAAKKFLNYKRDLLKDEHIGEIESRRADLRKAIKAGDREQCQETSKQLQATCENALPRQQQQGWFEENLEVIFVAIVIALGLRAYVVQPFKIPTGSMQPTLNGIIATPVDSTDKFPNFAQRQLERITHGRKYVDLVLDQEKRLRKNNPLIESNFLSFFTKTEIHFDDGSSETFPGPRAQLLGRDPHTGKGFGFGILCQYIRHDDPRLNQIPADQLALLPYDSDSKGRRVYYYRNPVIPADTVIARGYIDSGDLILVDKISYHFRKPERGEVFVFDTREIQAIRSQDNPGSHYIKRLAGTPGDQLQIRGTDLYINDKEPTEPGILKVMNEGGDYRGYAPTERLANQRIMKARQSDQPGMNEYIALGDNSYSSSDSRHWGTVKEFNVIGPAAFTLWPFNSGHWGRIK